MAYKTILLTEDTYNKVSAAKRLLSERLKKKLSFGDLLDEVFGRNIDFLDIDKDLLAYIKGFCARMDEEYVLGALLFGSVAKGTYDQNSDIDVLVVVSDIKYRERLMERVHAAKKELEGMLDTLIGKRLPTFISPVVVEEKALMQDFKPIYLDFLDYGVILFERHEALSRFLGKMSGIKHWREFTPYEVLRWHT